MKIYLALYKNKRKRTDLKNTWFRFCDDAIKFFTKSKYSHCEIAIKLNEKTYTCYSASNMDGGVRMKEMELSSDKWDFIDISNALSVRKMERFFIQTKGLKYDLFGALGVILGFGNKKTKYFCSEWCSEALNIKQAHKQSPESLKEILLQRGYKYV